MGMKAVARTRQSIATGVTAWALMLAVPGNAQLVAKDICDETTNELSRERLALQALANAGVSPYPLRWVELHRATGDQRSAAEILLATESFCTEASKETNDIPRCGKDDNDRIGAAQDAILTLLRDADHYVVPGEIRGTPALFSRAEPIKCVADSFGALAAATPTDRPAPFDQKTVPLRIRGSTDGLQFDRNLDTAFNGVDKASFTFKDDDAAAKDTTKAAIVVGLAVPVVRNFQLIPYFGFEADTSKKEGEDEQVTTDIARVGALFDVRTHGAGISHLFLFRPEYAANAKERSEVVTGSLLYQPIINGYLNIARNIAPGRQKLFSIIPRLDLRMVAGDFTKLGDRLPENSQDFVRVGGQIGLTITSDVKWLPLEFAVTETYLNALQGELDDLSYLKAVLSLYFDEKKFFGIDLGYARGRKDDLSPREHNWSFGFGAKF